MRILAITNEHLGHVTGVHNLLRHAYAYGHEYYHMFLKAPSTEVLRVLADARILWQPECLLSQASAPDQPRGADHGWQPSTPDFVAIYRNRRAVWRMALAASEPAPRVVRGIERVIREQRIDLVVTDGLVTSAVLGAYWAGVPCAAVHAGCAPFFTTRRGPEFEAADRLAGLRTAVFERYGVCAHAWVQNHIISEHANLMLSTSAFVGRRVPRVPFQYRFVGPLLFERPLESGHTGRPALPAEPFVFVSFGSLATGRLPLRLARLVADACAALHMPCVVAKGNLASTAGVRAVVCDYDMPYAGCVARSAVCVGVAGMNSLNQALLAGVPTLAFPMYFDQYDSAMLLQESGAGECLDPDRVSGRRVRRTLERLLSERSYRIHAANIAESYRTAGGVSAAFECLAGACA